MNIKRTTKVAALFLSIVMLLQSLPLASFAEYINSNPTPNAEAGSDFLAHNTSLGNEDYYELADKRDLYSKQFRMADGTITAVTYNEQIHYMTKNGEYDNIDNRLEKSEDHEGKSIYTNRANSFTISFSETPYNGEIYQITEDDIFIRFKALSEEYGDAGNVSNPFDSISKSKAEIIQNDVTAPLLALDSQNIGVLTSISSEIIYPSVSSGIDLLYRISGNRIKDDIILYNRSNSYSFLFSLELGGLTPVLNDVGSIVLIDNEGLIRYSIPAPYMYDASGSFSYDVYYELEQIDKEYLLRVTASSDWINCGERVFPVAIDPEIICGACDSSAIADSDVKEGDPTARAGYNTFMLTGFWLPDSALQHMRIYSKLRNLPEIPDSAIIVKATYNLRQYVEDPSSPDWKDFHSYGTNNLMLGVREVTNSWYETPDESPNNYICWNNQPSFDNNIVDYQIVESRNIYNSTNNGIVEFDITSIAQKWHETGICNGITVFPVKEYESGDTSYAFATFYTRDNPYHNETDPYYSFVYRDNKGLEDYWTFNKFAAGEAGSWSVNDFSGNIVFESKQIDANCEEFPLSIFLVYNGYQKNVQFDHMGIHTGKGWRLNIQEKVEWYSVASGNETLYYFIYIDEDGTEHYFKRSSASDMSASDEDEQGFELSWSSGEFTLVNTKKGYYTKKFDSLGRLTQIINGDKKLDFIYNTINNAERLSAINYGNTTLFSFSYGTYYNALNTIISNSGETIKLSYTYDYNNPNIWFGIYDTFLRRIEYNNGTSTTDDDTTAAIEYFSSGLIASTKEGNNSITASYAHNRPSIISIWRTSGGADYLDNQIKIDFTGHLTTTYRTSGANCIFENTDTSSDDIVTKYTFDDWGHTTETISYRADGKEYYGAMSYEYDNETEGSLHNPIIVTEGNCGNANIYNNTLFDNISPNVFSGYYVCGDTNVKYLGRQSLKIVATSATTNVKKYSVSFPYTITNDKMIVSGYIKTSNVSGNAYIRVVSASDETIASSQLISGTTSLDVNGGWQKVYLSLPSQSYNGHRIEYVLDSDCGTAWFDLVQVEYADDIPGRTNLICNGSFYGGLQTGWTSSGYLNSISAMLSPHFEMGIGLEGNISGTSYLQQEVSVCGALDEVYSVSGWAIANAVRNDDIRGSLFGIETTVFIKNFSTEDVISLEPQITELNTDTYDWQFFLHTVRANLSDNFDYTGYCLWKIKVKLVYANNVNKAYFSGISLSRSTSMAVRYETNGSISQFDVTSGSNHFSIDNNGTITPASNDFGVIYEYYENDQTLPLREIYSDGLTIEYTYVQKTLYSKNDDGTFSFGSVYKPQYIRYYLENNLRNEYYYYWSSVNATGTSYPVYLYCSNETLYRYDDTQTLTTYDYTVYTTYLKDGERFELPDYTWVRISGGSFIGIMQFNYDARYNLIKKVWHDYSGGVDNYIHYVEKYSYDSEDRLVSETDRLGNTVTYTYDNEDRLLTKTDVKGTTTYSYDSVGNVSQMQFSGGTINTSVGYTYGDDGLEEINANTDYVFSYDIYGNRTAVSLSDGTTSRNIMTYAYNSNGTLYYKKYANGWYERYKYDNSGNVTEIYRELTLGTFEGYPAHKFYYSGDGLLVEHRDVYNGTRTVYEYNDDGERLKTIQYDSDGTTNLQIEKVFDGSSVKKIRYFIENSEFDEIEYTYDDNSLLVKYKTIAGEAELNYDVLNQLVSKSLKISNMCTLTHYFTYVTGTVDGIISTSNLVATVELPDGTTYGYTYDGVGNITSVSENGILKLSYTYDALSQLTRENNAYADKTFVFSYDNCGNILTKSEYAYTTGTLGAAISTKSYTYGDGLWKDMLTAYNGITITYDNSGNPLSYNNGNSYTFSWKNGRELSTLTKGNTSVAYYYNADSVRIKKTVNGIIHEYIVDGYKILEEKFGNTILKYTYDENDVPQSINYNDTTYYYGLNLQGDITKIFDSSGAAIVEYTYDAWGNILSVTSTGTNGYLIKDINPFRYRGYYYDTESGLYYLNSRYYDPLIGRFINSDIIAPIVSNHDILDYGLFTYCTNNPVNLNDFTGKWYLNYVGGGLQLELNIGSVCLGLELIYANDKDHFHSFVYNGISVSDTNWANVLCVLKNISLAYLLKNPYFAIQSVKSLFSGGASISVCVFIIFRKWKSKFDANLYQRGFKGISALIPTQFAFLKVKGYSSWSKDYFVTGAGLALSFGGKLSVGISYTYYADISGGFIKGIRAILSENMIYSLLSSL